MEVLFDNGVVAGKPGHPELKKEKSLPPPLSLLKIQSYRVPDKMEVQAAIGS